MQSDLKGISTFPTHNPCAIDCEFPLTALYSSVYIIIRKNKFPLVYLAIFKSVQVRASAVKSVAELVCRRTVFDSASIKLALKLAAKQG